MVNPPQLMGSADHLRQPFSLLALVSATITLTSWSGYMIGFMPITIILVPLPGTANLGFLLHELGMKMANRGIIVD